jgi:hypothetical protein
MSNESAVEYWEKYATHAFDNTDSAVFSSCILMTPSGRPIAASMCFTIKRDIFDLPSVIVGNVSGIQPGKLSESAFLLTVFKQFLPILS